MVTCTCGENIPTTSNGLYSDRHYDVSGYCDDRNHVVDHARCNQNLSGATGWHWWCACECHPEPEEYTDGTGTRALETWRRAREARAIR